MRKRSVTLLLLTVFLTTAAYGNPKAGFMTTEVDNGFGPEPMLITVWYPTSNETKEPGEYDFLAPPMPLANFPGPAVTPGAIQDARIKGGRHPLIITYPGGGGPETRFTYFPNAELLAADGYIVVEPGRNTRELADQGPLLSDLIDHMLFEHPLRDSIEPSQIGAKGLSFGGIGVSSLAGGDVFGNPPDPRVRGVIIDEGIIACGALTNCESVTIPVLLRDGGILNIGDQSNNFAGLENAFPRFLVTLRDVTHFGFVTGICAVAEAARQHSLAYQQEVFGEIIEREPRNWEYEFVALDTCIATQFQTCDEAGYLASFIWSFDYSPESDFGSAGDFCRSEYGGPAPRFPHARQPVLPSQAMIETLHTTDVGFWETVFGNGQPMRTKLEKAVETLDTVVSIVSVKE